MSFDNLGLHADLLKGIRDLGFAAPLPVQSRAIPHILAGRDVIACAKTGSGKTAAFMLPILHRLIEEGKRRGPRALVLAPTRELALQSTQHLEALSRYVSVRGTAIFGGVAMAPQIKALKEGVDIISATPGRLLDHVQSRRVNLSSLQILVLDEADRMLDMGFLPDIRRILSLVPEERQTIVVSATIPDAIAGLIARICRDPVMLQVDEKDKPPEKIRHALYEVTHEQKVELLVQIMKGLPQDSSVLIFTRTKEGADRVAGALHKNGIQNECLHGDRDQRERTRALEALKSGTCRALVATDLASRGIDIKGLSLVINYDPPDTSEAYIHRIGRTGRVDAEGDAVTLMAPAEEPWVIAIEAAIGQRLARKKMPGFKHRASEVHGSYHPRPFYIRSRPAGGRGPRRR